jgi:hypothetical protein
LQKQRSQISAKALSDLGRYEDALNMLRNDPGSDTALLRMDILWAAKDWPNVINTAEDILGKRKDLTAELTVEETNVLLKLALGYSFTSDSTQLRYLRDYYVSLIPEGNARQVFEFITNDTTPLEARDISPVTQQISNTERFLEQFKSTIRSGKLSSI